MLSTAVLVDGLSAGLSRLLSAGEIGLMSALGVRRDKGGAFQWVQVPPGKRSSRKQPEQSWR